MYEYHTLPNGIKIIYKHTDSYVAYSGVYINVGSRDDSTANGAGDTAGEGMAHFIEHSLFKGTEHRRAFHILNRIDGVGGELNAFTTKEETCLYATSLTKHLPRCIELYADILFHSTFPQAEIEKEKDVVIEEIDSYRDSPAELIYDQYEELAFEGHPLAHNILGSKRNVRHFTAEQLKAHMTANYTPDRMVISVVGNVDFRKVVKLCETYFGGYTSHPSTTIRGDKPVFHPFTRTVNRRTHQTHLLTGCPAPDIYSNDKTAFTLLNNILGGPAMNSRLNVAIRERYGFCYNIEAQYVPFSDTGLFYVYAGIEHGSHEHVLRLICNELERIATKPMSDRQLSAAKQQFISQLAINNDNGSNEMQSIGKAYLNFDHVDTLDEMNADIMNVSTDNLQRIAHKYFDSCNYGTLIYGN